MMVNPPNEEVYLFWICFAKGNSTEQGNKTKWISLTRTPWKESKKKKKKPLMYKPLTGGVDEREGWSCKSPFLHKECKFMHTKFLFKKRQNCRWYLVSERITAVPVAAACSLRLPPH